MPYYGHHSSGWGAPASLLNAERGSHSNRISDAVCGLDIAAADATATGASRRNDAVPNVGRGDGVP